MSHENAGAASPTRSQGQRPLVRPLSPHLQVWRWHVTMLGSILHRASGVALYAGAVLVVAWLAVLAVGPEAYATFADYAGSRLGLLLWFLFTAAAFYHLASGVRHLVWDLGYGLNPRTANLLTNLSLLFGVLATIGFWVWLLTSGKVQL